MLRRIDANLQYRSRRKCEALDDDVFICFPSSMKRRTNIVDVPKGHADGTPAHRLVRRSYSAEVPPRKSNNETILFIYFHIL